jgi:hypothetical protein
VISVPSITWNFGTSLQSLYNYFFAKLTENELLTSLYNKINDLITKFLLLLVYKTGYKGYSYSYFVKYGGFLKQN